MSRYIDAGRNGDCLWTVDKDYTLLIEPLEGTDGILDDYNGDEWPWEDYAQKIRKVIVEDGVAACANMAFMFSGMENCCVFDIAALDTRNTRTMDFLFYNCRNLTDLTSVAGWDVSRVEKMYGIFAFNTALSNISSLAGWDVSSVTDMRYMFSGCAKITEISPLTGWNTEKVWNMEGMFNKCCSLTDLSPLAGWHTKRLSNIAKMFEGCTGITDLSPLKGWDTKSLGDMKGTFENCTGITDLTPLADWDVGGVKEMTGTFCGCTGITDINPLAGWDTGSVNNMQMMFSGCSRLSDVSAVKKWNISKLKEAYYMFRETSVKKNPLEDMVPMACPEKGEFIGWKKCREGSIVKLRIPADAKRSAAFGKGCRCNKAEVLEIWGANKERILSALSIYDPDFVYREDETVSLPVFDEDRFAEYAAGIHFFMDRLEAEKY